MYSRLMTVNCLGVVELSRNIVPDMLTRGAGEVVVVSSVQGVLPIPFRSDRESYEIGVDSKGFIMV